MKPTPLLALLLCALTAGAEAEIVSMEKKYRIRGDMELDMRVDGGKVEILRSEDNDCHILIEYDRERCRADVNLDEDTDVLELFVDHDNWAMTKKSVDDKSKYARIRISLPPKADLALNLEMKAGELDVKVGDLHIKSFELRSYAGKTSIDFDQPNRCEMKTFDVDFKVGEVKLYNLGNANFAEADINSSVGSMLIDFNGEKIEQAMARIDLEIGESTIVVPEKIGVKIKVSKFLFLSNVDYPNWFTQEGSYYYSRNYNKKKESLYLVVSTGIGELKIRVDKKDD
ncbi:MAG TPA: LiaF-related protein [bacterium]|nr:LiaF-related protein [bacterium]HPG82928.1 LiaF-related protein [bacterium]HPM59702.1 LiaF-related protein [bacterium]